LSASLESSIDSLVLLENTNIIITRNHEPDKLASKPVSDRGMFGLIGNPFVNLAVKLQRKEAVL
jgi:hypothetical protein